jgi:hypothetical protein
MRRLPGPRKKTEEINPAAQGIVSCSHALDKIIFDCAKPVLVHRKKEILNKNTVQLFEKGFFNKMFYPEHGCMMQCLVQREMMHEKGFI